MCLEDGKVGTILLGASSSPAPCY